MKYGAAYCTSDAGQIMHDPDVDAILIATRHGSHTTLAIDALAAGTTGYGGYLLFPTTGTYRIQGFTGDRKIGEITLAISDQPYPQGQ